MPNKGKKKNQSHDFIDLTTDRTPADTKKEIAREKIRQQTLGKMSATDLANVTANATAIATILGNELRLSFEISTKAHDVDVIYDEPPLRTELGFQISEGQDVPKLASKNQHPIYWLRKRKAPPLAAKATSDAKRADSQANDKYIVMGDNIYLSISNIDIDHATPYATVIKRQLEFIAFLNGPPNLGFATVFLALSTPLISNFFKRDPRDGRIKGTKYFFKSGYSACANLWLMSHDENIKKSDKEFIQWAKETDKSFIKPIEERGGKKRGLFMDVVTEDSTTPAVARLTLQGVGCDIYPGVGVGAFIEQWVARTHAGEITVRQDFYHQLVEPLLEHLSLIEHFHLNGQIKEGRIALTLLRKKLSATADIIGIDLSPRSDSGSDSEVHAAGSSALTEKTTRDNRDKSHYLKTINKMLLTQYPSKEMEMEVVFAALYAKAHDIPVESLKALRNTALSWRGTWTQLHATLAGVKTSQEQVEAGLLRETYERQQKEQERSEKEAGLVRETYERRQKEQERSEKEQIRREKEQERSEKEAALQYITDLTPKKWTVDYATFFCCSSNANGA